MSSCYHRNNFDPPVLRREATKVIDKLKEWNLDPDAIAFTGISGSAISFAVSALGGYQLACVRRSDDTGNHGNRVECNLKKIKEYIILDDLIASGRTINHIVEQMKEYYPDAELTAIVLTGEHFHKYRHRGVRVYITNGEQQSPG